MTARVRDLLEHAIQTIDGVSDPEDFPAIRIVRAELVDMRTHLDAHGGPERPPRRRGLGRLVTDSWPLKSDVGTAVIAAEMAYEAHG